MNTHPCDILHPPPHLYFHHPPTLVARYTHSSIRFPPFPNYVLGTHPCIVAKEKSANGSKGTQHIHGQGLPPFFWLHHPGIFTSQIIEMIENWCILKKPSQELWNCASERQPWTFQRGRGQNCPETENLWMNQDLIQKPARRISPGSQFIEIQEGNLAQIKCLSRKLLFSKRRILS